MAWNERKKQQTSRINLFAPKETSYSETQIYKDLVAKGKKYAEDRREEIASQPSLNRKDGRDDKQILKNVKGYNQSHEAAGNIGIPKRIKVEVEGGTNIGPAPNWSSEFKGPKTQQKTVKTRQKKIQNAFEKNAPFEEEQPTYSEEPAFFRKKGKTHKTDNKRKIIAPEETPMENGRNLEPQEAPEGAKEATPPNAEGVKEEIPRANGSTETGYYDYAEQPKPEPLKYPPAIVPEGKEEIPATEGETHAGNRSENSSLDGSKEYTAERKLKNAKKVLGEHGIDYDNMNEEEILAAKRNIKKDYWNKRKAALKGNGKAAFITGSAIGMGALVFGLSNSRGQQSNAQLYGQQPIQY